MQTVWQLNIRGWVVPVISKAGPLSGYHSLHFLWRLGSAHSKWGEHTAQFLVVVEICACALTHHFHLIAPPSIFFLGVPLKRRTKHCVHLRIFAPARTVVMYFFFILGCNWFYHNVTMEMKCSWKESLPWIYQDGTPKGSFLEEVSLVPTANSFRHETMMMTSSVPSDVRLRVDLSTPLRWSFIDGVTIWVVSSFFFFLLSWQCEALGDFWRRCRSRGSLLSFPLCFVFFLWGTRQLLPQ